MPGYDSGDLRRRNKLIVIIRLLSGFVHPEGILNMKVYELAAGSKHVLKTYFSLFTYNCSRDLRNLKLFLCLFLTKYIFFSNLLLQKEGLMFHMPETF